MIPTASTPIKHPYYSTTTLCPFCSRLLPGEVFGRDKSVYLSRECPEHGSIEALICSDINWFEGLKRFDVAPVKPAHPQQPVRLGCPLDCGLCASHRQVAGTIAIEISNRCNANCPVCLGDNRGGFEMSVEEIRALVEDAIHDQGQIGVLTLSGGEPTIHPQFFDILSMLDRPEIGRINLNSNGLRMVQEAGFVDRLRHHPKVYVSLHYDGQNAEQIRGTRPELQEQALDFAALGILLLFDQMERQLECGGRGHPLLQVVKLDARGAIGRWSWGRGSGEGHHSYRNITVR